MKLFAATSLCIALSALGSANAQNCTPQLEGAPTGPFVKGSAGLNLSTYSWVSSMMPFDDPHAPSLVIAGSLYLPDGPMISSGTESYAVVPAARFQQGRWLAMPNSAQLAGSSSLALAQADFSGVGGATDSIYSVMAFPGNPGNVTRWDGTSWVRTVTAPALDPVGRTLLSYTDAQGTVLLAGSTSIYAWRGSGDWTVYAPFNRTSGEFTRLRALDDGSGMALFAMGTMRDNVNNIRYLVKLVDGAWTQYDLPPAALASLQVTDIAMFDDGTSTTGPEVYVAWQNTGSLSPTSTSIARKRNGAWETIAQDLPSDSVVTGTSLLVRTIHDVPHLYLANNTALQEWTASGWTIPFTTGTYGSSQPGGAVSDIVNFNDGNGDQTYFGGQFTEFFEGPPAAYNITRATPAYSLIRTSEAGLTSFAQGVGYATLAGWNNSNYMFSLDLAEGPRLLVGSNIKRAGGRFADGAAMFDGRSWSNLGGSSQGSGPVLSATTATINGQARIVAKHFTGTRYWDGTQWVLLPAQPAAGTLLTFNNTLYAFGPNLQRYTGSSWETVATGSFYAGIVADLGNGARIVLGTTAGVSEFDGTSLTQVGPNIPAVRAIAVVNDGPGPRIYVYAPTRTNKIARLTNGSWEDLPPGVHNVDSDSTLVIASFDDGNGPALYVTGHTSFSTSVVPGAIARWRNDAWGLPTPPVAPGQVGKIVAPAMAVVGDRLYITGSFARISSIAADHLAWIQACPRTCDPDFDGDNDPGADADIEAFFNCLAGNCCPRCTADFNNDGDTGTDADIESFFRVLAGGPC